MIVFRGGRKSIFPREDDGPFPLKGAGVKVASYKGEGPAGELVL